MNKMKRIAAVSLAAVLFAGSASTALAQTSSSTDALFNQVQSLLKQVKSLQDQIEALNAKKSQLSADLQETLRLTKSLSLGMTNEEVKFLQEILAADPGVYPEGLVTGFYGSLTEKAVKKFQAKYGIEQAGIVGPKTMSKMNELQIKKLKKENKKDYKNELKYKYKFEDDDDNDNKTKVTLCHKPGGNTANANTLVVGASAVAAHLAHGDSLGACGTTPTTPPVNDNVAPAISNIAAVGSSSTTAYIYWTTNENATSTMWYASTTPVNKSTASKVSTNTWKTVHSLNLSGLTATTTYYYLIEVADAAGNVSTSTEHSFKTLEN